MLASNKASLRVLSTPELIDHVFSELERDDLVQPALVDMKWADIARDYIWREVATPCQLFRILAPLKTHEPEHVRRISSIAVCTLIVSTEIPACADVLRLETIPSDLSPCSPARHHSR